MKDYMFMGYSNGKKFCINGIDVFTHKWITLGECDIVLEPTTKKPYSFSLYKVESGDRTVTFLAGQFSDERWGFYCEGTDDDF